MTPIEVMLNPLARCNMYIKTQESMKYRNNVNKAFNSLYRGLGN